MTDNDLPVFLGRMCLIIEYPSQRIVKDGSCLFEANPVLAEVVSRFLGIPLKDHSPSLSQHSRARQRRTCFAEEEYQKMSERYQQFLQEGRFADRYRLDYLVVDRETDQWRIDFLNRFEVVGTVSEFIIYKKMPLGLSFSIP